MAPVLWLRRQREPLTRIVVQAVTTVARKVITLVIAEGNLYYSCLIFIQKVALVYNITFYHFNIQDTSSFESINVKSRKYTQSYFECHANNFDFVIRGGRPDYRRGSRDDRYRSRSRSPDRYSSRPRDNYRQGRSYSRSPSPYDDRRGRSYSRSPRSAAPRGYSRSPPPRDLSPRRDYSRSPPPPSQQEPASYPSEDRTQPEDEKRD